MCGNGGLCVERRMPASSGDPVSTALHMSLANNKCSNLKNDDLDTKIIASARRVLLSEIKYEPSGSYANTVLDSLKSKYIVLNTNVNDVNDVKVKNGPVTKESTTTSSSSACSQSAKESPKRGKSEVTLPTPKRILYPPDGIQLGWQGSTPIGSGMINMGNTCYLNSTLQALFHIPAFVNWVLNDKTHSSKCVMINGTGHTECLICAVLKTLQFAQRNSGTPIKPIQIYSKLKMICKHLVHGHQEDAHEFLRYLIESMERSYLAMVQGTKLDSYSKETTPLNQIFGGYLRTEVTCLECRHVSTTFQHFQDLLLDIRTVGSVEDALDAYFSREQLEGDEAYRCENCHRRVPATKKFSIQKAPNVLCMQLKRFGIMGGKISKHVSLQQTLDLSRFMHPSNSNNLANGSRLKYRLVSMISHIGPSASCGHYTAMGQSYGGQFYLFDDSMVRPVSLSTVLNTNAYVIMYELERPNSNVQRTIKPISALTITTNGINGKSLQNGMSCASSKLPPLVNKPAIIMTPNKIERACSSSVPSSAATAASFSSSSTSLSSLSVTLSPLSSTTSSSSPSSSSSSAASSSLQLDNSGNGNASSSNTPQKPGKLPNGLLSPSKSLVPYTPNESSDSESEAGYRSNNSTKQAVQNSSTSGSSSSCASVREPKPVATVVNGINKNVAQKNGMFLSSKTSVKDNSSSVLKVNGVSTPSNSGPSLSKAGVTGVSVKRDRSSISPNPSSNGQPSSLSPSLPEKKANNENPPTLIMNGWHVTDSALHSPSSTGSSSVGSQWSVTEISKACRTSEKAETVTNINKKQTSDLSDSSKSASNGVNSNPVTPATALTSSTYAMNGNSSSGGGNSSSRESNWNLSNGNGNTRMWDGSRNTDTVNQLLKMSHRGYGTSNAVNTWKGGRSELDQEVETERHEQQRKRSHHSQYDEEMDRGKVKKVKGYFSCPKNDGGNSLRRYNPFQEHQNRKNSWHGNGAKRHQFYRQYNNMDRYSGNRHRVYQNSYSQWRH